LFPVSQEGYEVVKATLETIENVQIRLEVIVNLLRRQIPADELCYFLDVLGPEIKLRACERNSVVQSNWYVDDKFPDCVVARLGGKYVKYVIKDFSDICERIIDTTNKMIQFFGRFQSREGLRSRNSKFRPEPD
jgi:hypothetical protein